MNEGQFAITIAVVSLVLALVSAFAAIKQANEAEKSRRLTVQNAKSDATIHFTTRFFDLLRDVPEQGIEHQILTSQAWAYQFWSLHATEFYFFHHGVLPIFMYSLWMVDLAALYAGGKGEQIRKSHAQYLNMYALNYNEMCRFYDDIYQLAKKHDNPSIRNEKIADRIKSWYKDNRPGT